MISLKRIFASFWIFGLVNNVLYVVILSSAVDLVGPTTPKAVVLIADVLPSFTLKLLAPFFIHIVPYNVRLFILVALSFFGMLIVSLSERVFFILFGIILASASSGLGETTFLQLTHYYPEISLSAWSSGTGGAGLVGAFAYMAMTTWMGISSRNTLLSFSVVPFAFLFIYFKLLPVPQINTQHTSAGSNMDLEDQQGLLPSSTVLDNSSLLKSDETLISHFKHTILRMKPYVLPYMLPLFSVYVAEYIINQGISPTLLFDIDNMPFKNYRDAYVTYGTLYQLGVFISRSSGSFIQLKRISLPAVLQGVNLLICILQSLYMFIPSIYIIFILIFYEGLLGGAAYVNTFMLVTTNTKLSEREFAMGCVGISDSAGIVFAASISMFLEPFLCHYQVNDDRPWCTMR